MTLLSRDTQQGVQMRRKAEKPESTRQLYYNTPRIQDMIDAIGKWGERQGVTSTRMQRGKIGYSATFAVQAALTWWANDIRASTTYSIDELRPFLLEYYNAIYIDKPQRTTAQLRTAHLDSMKQIYDALKRSHVPLHYSDEQANNILIITVALARMAAEVSSDVDPLLPPPNR